MELPIIDLDLFLSQPRDSIAVLQECEKAADALITYGALILRDSRVAESDNDAFLDLLEDYFAQSQSDLQRDERPELSYQVGVTLENTERPKCAVDEPCLKIIERLEPSERPLDISAHSPDPKCRFFWKMGEGGDLADMAATGLGIKPDTFRNAGKYGPHILAPTASDLVKYGQKDNILAGFHTDLNFLTIHGRSRRRLPVKIPQGNYLLVQAGKQLEHITGGLVKAGYHEVVVNDQTIEVIERRKVENPDRPLIRISSTFFWHLSSDYDLTPIPSLAERSQVLRASQIELGQYVMDEPIYEPMKVGQQVQNELKHIALMA
ncbi:Clavaminate synthase-like protein [Gymnopus androsaceus JB14]|uniref:Clavaminate synthase-like protein n=1 Tax=Gymnopus androsaceus JB14 TaxID=1447944 RepID=A0A6A4HNR7_9AGAR|nr:Clavaminate synthase-like protein [Gymnopus androsaceus JB14]